MNIVGALRIYLGARYTAQPEIGLYTPPSTGNSELRWSESPLAGVALTFYHSQLLKNGVGNTVSSIDATYGGNQEAVNDITFSITGALQLPLRLEELSIQISGKTVEYIEYCGTDEDSDATSIDTIGTFTIEDMQGNEFETSFTAKSSFLYKRNKLLATRITAVNFPDGEGDTIPVTFGRSDPDNGRFFKLPRIEYRNVVLSLKDFLGEYGFPQNTTLLPARAPTEDNLAADQCQVLAGEYTTFNPVSLVGMYLKDVEGDGTENTGAIRRISSYSLAELGTSIAGYPDQALLSITLSQYFFKEIDSYRTGSLTWKAFLSIIDAFFRYALDFVQCECFLSGSDFYLRNDDEMVRVADVGVSQIASGVPDYEISPISGSDEVGRTVTFKILPMGAVEPYLNEDSGLEQWGHATYHHPLDLSSDPVAGVFIEDTSTMSADAQGVITNPTYFNDRDYTSYLNFAVSVDINPINNFNYYLAFKLTLPEIDSSVQFDKAYLGIRLKSICTDDGGSDPDLTVEGAFIVAHRRYYGEAITPVDVDTIEFQDNRAAATIESLPDEYYTLHTPSTKDKAFYYSEATSLILTGYQTFDLEITTAEEYNNIHEMVMMLYRWGVQNGISDHIDDSVSIYELAVIFETDIAFDKEVYA